MPSLVREWFGVGELCDGDGLGQTAEFFVMSLGCWARAVCFRIAIHSSRSQRIETIVGRAAPALSRECSKTGIPKELQQWNKITNLCDIHKISVSYSYHDPTIRRSNGITYVVAKVTSKVNLVKHIRCKHTLAWFSLGTILQRFWSFGDCIPDFGSINAPRHPGKSVSSMVIVLVVVRMKNPVAAMPLMSLSVVGERVRRGDHVVIGGFLRSEQLRETIGIVVGRTANDICICMIERMIVRCPYVEKMERPPMMAFV